MNDSIDNGRGDADDGRFEHQAEAGSIGIDGEKTCQALTYKRLELLDAGDDKMFGEIGRMNQRVLSLVEGNDPAITSLSVTFFDCRFDPRIDWEHVGSSIGKNSHLKKLKIEGIDDAMVGAYPEQDSTATRTKFELFCEGVALNRSIEHLILGGIVVNLIGESMFAILHLFFEQNPKLRHFVVNCSEMGIEGARSFASAMARCNKSSLRKIDLRVSRIDDERVGGIIASLGGLENLTEFHLGKNKTGRAGCAALGTLLRNRGAKLRDINLVKSMIDDEGALSLAGGLAVNTTLKSLNLGRNGCIGAAGWRAISSALQSPSSSLEVLILNRSNIDDEGARMLADGIANSAALKTVDMSANNSITKSGWRTFFSLLHNVQSPLNEFDLNNNRIDDDAINAMVKSFYNISTLETILIEYNGGITRRGWWTFSDLLRGPGCPLKRVFCNSCWIDDGVVPAFAGALSGNTRLTTLQLSNSLSRGCVTPEGWTAFSNLVCDESSISATHSSNHTLFRLVDFPGAWRADPTIKHLVPFLELNQNPNKAVVARRKILQVHFLKCNKISNIDKFVEMEAKAMPQAIAWIGNDGTGFPLMYELFLATPSLFDSGGRAKAQG